MFYLYKSSFISPLFDNRNHSIVNRAENIQQEILPPKSAKKRIGNSSGWNNKAKYSSGIWNTPIPLRYLLWKGQVLLTEITSIHNKKEIKNWIKISISFCFSDLEPPIVLYSQLKLFRSIQVLLVYSIIDRKDFISRFCSWENTIYIFHIIDYRL